MLPSTSFFKRTTVLEKKKTGAEKTVIDVGGEPFHALAVAFIDSLKNGASLPDASLKEVLSQFFVYFPDYKINQVYITLTERMRILMNNPRKTEIVDCLAYVLRQIAVDELLKNPLAYKEVFQDLNDLPQAYLRKADTALPPSALASLVVALKIKLVLSFKEPQKELRRREVYTSTDDASSFAMELQVQGSRYFPKVKNKDDFAHVGQLAIAAPKPISPLGNETIAQQLEEIAADNHKIWQDYEHNLGILNGLLFDQELTKAKLVSLYTRFLPQRSERQLFASLESSYGKTKIVGAPGNREEEDMTMLATVLARALSTGQINTEDFFEFLEQPQQRHTAAPAA